MTTPRSLVSSGRFDAALKALAGLSGPEAARLRAAALVGKKRGRQALAELAEAEPDHPETILLTGRALLLASDAHGAVATFRRLPAGFPGRAEALAGACRRDARYAEAVAVAEAETAPSRQLRYERAMALSAMGEAEAALAAFDALNRDFPDHAASWVGGAGPALDLRGEPEARRRVERAASCAGANGKYRALAAALDRLAGRPAAAPEERHRALVDGVAALLPHLAPACRVFGTSRRLLEYAVAEARVAGLVTEFGVRRGTSVGHIARAAEQPVHGFDSFAGLPEDWGNESAGVLTCGRDLPEVPANVTLHAGWFEDTLPPFLAAHAGAVRLLNIDSDIYASARLVLAGLGPRLVAGSLVVFDEMIGNRTWRDDEWRAWSEFAAASGVGWQVAALSPFTKQACLRITRPPRC